MNTNRFNISIKRFLTFISIFITSIHCLGVFEKEKEDPDGLNLLTLALGRSLQNYTPDCTTNEGFWVRNIQENKSDCIGSIEVARRGNISVHREIGLETNMDYESIADDFETKIHPALVEAFGAPGDINNDGKVDVFILDIRDGARPNGPFVAGFFDPVDFFQDNANSPLRSNEREILYMDGKELVALLNRDPLAFGSTLAHEYQHLIRFPRMQSARTQDHIWINEGTSEIASDIGGFGPQNHRLNCFLGRENSPCEGGGNGVSLLEWSTGPPGDSSYILKQYAYAYSFMRFLYDNPYLQENQRIQFLRDSVNGDESNLRGSDILSLMDLYRKSTNLDNNNPFPTNPLGSDSAESFQILMNSFWGQIIPDSNMENVSRSDSGGSFWNLSSTESEFSINGILGSLESDSFPVLDALPENIRASAGVVLNRNLRTTIGSVTGTKRLTSIPNPRGSTILFSEANRNLIIATNQNQVLSWKDFRSRYHSGSKESFQGHSNNTNKSFSGLSKFHDPGSNPIPVCGHPFLERINESERKIYKAH